LAGRVVVLLVGMLSPFLAAYRMQRKTSLSFTEDPKTVNVRTYRQMQLTAVTTEVVADSGH